MGRKIVVDIIGDSSKFTKATQDATTHAGKFKNVLTGMGQGIGIAAFNGIGMAASAVAGAFMDGVRGAMEEEKSIARLTQSIKANVPAWDGNTSAIMAQIDAREDLAFSDDQLRDSLGTLVAATHDVTKAQDLQRTAMDLARFRSIDLTDASQALVKVEGGQYRALKALGIVLKEGATQTEALAAVQAVTFGQAETYANTTTGKLETAQIRINDAFENFGGLVLPATADAIDGARKALSDFIYELDRSGTEINRFGYFGGSFDKNMHSIAGHTEYAAVSTEHYGTAAADALRPTLNWAAAMGRVHKQVDGVTGAIQAAIDHVLDYIDVMAMSGLGEGSGSLKGGAKPRRSKGKGETGKNLVHAAGGWVGLNGPELGILGESGPEYIVPNHRLRGGGGGVTVYVAGNVVGASGIDELSDMIARRLNLDGV